MMEIQPSAPKVILLGGNHVMQTAGKECLNSPPSMTGLCTTNGCMLGLKGVPDYNYVI
jgi:hypothetical protein